MAMAYKVLGQQNPLATTDTTLYTVPGATSTVVSSLVVCNRSAAGTTFRVAVRPGGAAISNEHYIAYDSAIGGNETISLTLGLSLATTDVVTIYAGAATLSFNLFGVENT